MRNDHVEPHRCGSDAARTGAAQARDRAAESGPGPAAAGAVPPRVLFDAVLFDRDGTLVHDVPYNGDPERVRPVAGARAALDLLRAAGLRLGVVTNQSGLAAGRFTPADLARVQARIEDLLGPFDTWQVCPHAAPAPGRPGCRCRKPAPGMVHDAARALGTVPRRCALIGDIGADMVAAAAAGATGILVPTEATRSAEIAAAPAVAGDLRAAVELVLRRQRLVAAGDRAPAARSTRPAWSPRPARSPGPTRSTGPARSPRAGEATEPVDAACPAGSAHPGGPRHVLVARPDSAGDVLVTGPAIRAVAAGADRVVMLCGPRGRAAAELLPGVDELVEWALPWIDPDPGAVDQAQMGRLVARLAGTGVTEAVLFTSFHQSPLPLALVLRMAGVRRICAISDDYPGALLDVRHRVPPGIPETERALSLAAAAGFPLPAGEEPELRLRPEALPGWPPAGRPPAAGSTGNGPAGSTGNGPAGSPGDGSPGDGSGRLPGDGYVVVHPGASVAARACPPELCRGIVAALVAAGHRVVVTGGPGEGGLTARVAGRAGVDLGGQTSLTGLAAVIARAGCLVVGNTGPAHLAAALGVPVVSLFAPTVPFGQWGPYRVPTVRLGDATAGCRHTRATTCPVPGHPCLSTLDPASVVAAVELLRTPAGPTSAGSASPAGPSSRAGVGPARSPGVRPAAGRPAVATGREGRA